MDDNTSVMRFLGWGLVITILVVLLGWALWLFYLHFIEGPAITTHTQNVRHSQGYVDAQNAHCEQDMGDYQAAAADYARDSKATDSQAANADQAHMNALVADCRNTVGQLSTSEVAPPVASFLSTHGG